MHLPQITLFRSVLLFSFALRASCFSLAPRGITINGQTKPVEFSVSIQRLRKLEAEAGQGDETESTEETSDEPLEINSVQDWVEARRKWEIDNVPYDPTVGATTRQELLGYAGFALGSFVFGTFMRSRNTKIDRERGIVSP